jgi:hypothetical protein
VPGGVGRRDGSRGAAASTVVASTPVDIGGAAAGTRAARVDRAAPPG